MVVAVEHFFDEANLLERECDLLPAKSSQRRSLFARCELLVMKINDLLAEDSSLNESEQQRLQESIRRLQNSSGKVKLSRASMGQNIVIVLLCRIDEFLRLVATWSFLILSSIFIALPCVFLLPLDHLLLHYKLVAPSQQINIYGKRFIAKSMMALSGVDIKVEDLRSSTFANECSIVCFSHASTMDAFLISLAIPLRHYTMAKSDLFLIPYFAWCLLAFGGVPIVRSNRGQAVRALEEAALWAKNGQCVAIAPEGTRSKTGQLTQFKKGAFHLWEQLNGAPIVPLVIYGAYDLFPPGHQICMPGKVYVRFLDPICVKPAYLQGQAHSSEETRNGVDAAISSPSGYTRDQVERLLRLRMLEAWRDGPSDAGDVSTLSERLGNVVLLSAYYSFLYILGKRWSFLVGHYGWTVYGSVGAGLGVSVLVTLMIYLYLMYISPLVTALLMKKKSRAKKD
eukprot:gene27990-33799_t